LGRPTSSLASLITDEVSLRVAENYLNHRCAEIFYLGNTGRVTPGNGKYRDMENYRFLPAHV
jgi:hypothetical protein